MQFGGRGARKRSAAGKERRRLAKKEAREASGATRPKKEGQVWTLKNGAAGIWRKNTDGKLVFRITQGASAEYMRSLDRTRRRAQKSMRAAKAAFTRFYNKRSYKSPGARRAAMTRDLCSNNKPVVTDSRYTRSPHRYDYKGWDDGSNCPTGKVNKARKASPAQAAALARGRANRARNLAARQSGGWARIDEAFIGPATTPGGKPTHGADEAFGGYGRGTHENH